MSVDVTTNLEIEDTFAAILRDAVFGGADLVLIEPYNGPRPKVAYAAIHLLDAKGFQHEIHGYYVKDGVFTERIKSTHWCRIIVQFYGGDAFGNAIKARNKLKSDLREFDLFRKVGMGNISDVMSIPDDYQAKVENRARFTIDFYAKFSDENESITIERVPGVIYRDGVDEIPFLIEKS